MNKYHQDVLQFWESLHKRRAFIEKQLDNEYSVKNVISKDLIVKFFNEYISMVSLLHKRDVFDASEHFSEILLWIKKYVIIITNNVNKLLIQTNKLLFVLL